MARPSSESITPNSRGPAPPPPPPRRTQQDKSSSHPLSQSQSSSDLRSANESYVSSARHKVAAAYNSLPEVRSYIPGTTGYNTSRPQPPSNSSSYSANSDRAPPPPPRRLTAASTTSTTSPQRLSWNNNSPEYDSSDNESYSPSNTGAPVNKKLDLWKRRWKRAKDILDAQGVVLRSWRTGSDVCLEAVQIVEKTLSEMGVEGYGKGKGNGNSKTGQGGGEMKVKDMKR